MDFETTDDQRALAEGIRSLLDGRFPLAVLRQAEGARRALGAEAWAELGEAGVFSLTVPEADGGVGLGLADAAVVFEELGRSLVPGPLVASAVAAGHVPGAADGTAMVTMATPPPPALPLVVEHLEGAAALLVVERSTVTVADPPPAGTLAEPLDPLSPVWLVPPPGPTGRVVAEGTAAARLWHQGALLTAALQVGHAAAVLEAAVAYARERSQFGRPIGSFQAVKHLCADMLVRAEVARCAVHAAACFADQPEAVAVEAEVTGLDPARVLERATAGAKVLADEAAVANARAAIQVHGGMGFTWEVPLHLHLKRSLVLATTFGTAHDLQAELAGLV